MQGLKDNQSVLLRLDFLFDGGKGCEQQQQQQQQQQELDMTPRLDSDSYNMAPPHLGANCSAIVPFVVPH